MSIGTPQKKSLSEREEIFYCEIGRRIAVFRKAAGLNQAELAQRVGVNKITIAKMETGRQRVPFFLIEHIGQVLNVEMAEIVGNVRQMLLSKKAPEPIDPKLLSELMDQKLPQASA